MTDAAAAPASPDNLRGILLMVLSMVCFGIGDTFIKLVSERVPPGQSIVVIGIVGALVLGALALARGLSWDGAGHPAVTGRNITEALGTTGIIAALAVAPLSTTAAIVQANPIVVTLGAALFLGEKVGLHRWGAILAGLLGVLIVIRPGSERFEPALLLPLLALLSLAARDLFTRRVPAGIPSIVLAALGFAAIVPAGALLLALGLGSPAVMPTAAEALLLAAATGFILMAYLSITISVRIADISVVSPFRYSRIVFATCLGIVVFAERPDGWMYLGMGVIIASGVYTVVRERRAALHNRRAAR